MPGHGERYKSPKAGPEPQYTFLSRLKQIKRMLKHSAKGTTVVSPEGALVQKKDQLGLFNQFRLMYFAHRQANWEKKDIPKAAEKSKHYQDKIDAILLKSGVVPTYQFSTPPVLLEQRLMENGLYIPLHAFVDLSALEAGMVLRIRIDMGRDEKYLLKHIDGRFEVYKVPHSPELRNFEQLVGRLMSDDLQVPFEQVLKLENRLRWGARGLGMLLWASGFALRGIAWGISTGAGGALYLLADGFQRKEARGIYRNQSERMDELSKKQAEP
ncbi:Uncharacterised protein [Candidatus Gugararchaeum adminiculabundum]|nr:Uncharacterised protein [Candidatus Gugararchaeum adminiculabundum]